MNFFVENALLIALLPLWIFLIIMFGQNLFVYDNRRITMLLTTASTLVGFIFSVFILFWTISNEEVYIQNYTWLQAGSISLSMGIMVDRLCAVMLMVVTSVSLLIQVYSHEYMLKDDGYHRFFAYLNLFNFSMLGLVLSSNLFQTYIFWELVGVSSYLLIGFWFRRPSAAGAATKAFIINRIGDFGLLIGILAVLFFSFSFWESSDDVLLGFSSLPQAAKLINETVGASIYAIIAFLVFMGPVAKSAQFPLHTWLPDAMEGPTPISALIHAATMVAAGVFLIARVYPLFEISHIVMEIILWTGAITAVMAALIAITQHDIKKVLAYSTCSQLGFMVMAMGAGAWTAGMFHLVTHAYFKAMLFLCSGAVIHGLNNQQDMKYMGGLRKHMPAVAYTYLIGCLAISGILLSGFWSKEEIFYGLLNHDKVFILSIALIVSGMTSFYMFRTYFLTFEGDYRGHEHPHNPSKIITVPLIILAVPSAILGFAFCGQLGMSSFDAFLSYLDHPGHHGETLLLPFISIFVALVGFILAMLLYTPKYRHIMKINLDLVLLKIKPVYNFSANLCYIDKSHSLFVEKLFLPASRLLYSFDKYILDGIVNLVSSLANFTGWTLKLFQNGNVQVYAAIMLGGLMFLTILFSIYQLL